MEQALLLAELQVLSENFISSATNHIAGNEYKVMLFLKIYGVCSPKIMINKIGILKTNLASILKNLVKDKLVEVSPNIQDGRGKQYALTKSGDELIATVLNDINKNIENDTSDELLKSLKTIVALLNKKL